MQEVDLLATVTKVRIQWIKAHFGHKGNELADKLAKQAAQAQGPEPKLPAPEAQRRRDIRTGMEREWATRWASHADCRQSQANWTVPDRTMSKALIMLPKEQISKIIQMFSGHDFFNYHRHITGEVEDPECRLCLEDDESSLHLLHECPSLAQRRFEILGYHQLGESYSFSHGYGNLHYLLPGSGNKPRRLSDLARFINLACESVNGAEINFTPT